MQEEIDLGCAPVEEDCAQLGEDGYHDRARRECRAFIGQLRRAFGQEPYGARLQVKRNPHDFGTYLTVACRFNCESQAAVNYVTSLEKQLPARWDRHALEAI